MGDLHSEGALRPSNTIKPQCRIPSPSSSSSSSHFPLGPPHIGGPKTLSCMLGGFTGCASVTSGAGAKCDAGLLAIASYTAMSASALLGPAFLPARAGYHPISSTFAVLSLDIPLRSRHHAPPHHSPQQPQRWTLPPIPPRLPPISARRR